MEAPLWYEGREPGMGLEVTAALPVSMSMMRFTFKVGVSSTSRLKTLHGKKVGYSYR